MIYKEMLTLLSESKAKRETEEVMDFDEYIEDVIKYFGKDSKEAVRSMYPLAA